MSRHRLTRVAGRDVTRDEDSHSERDCRSTAAVRARCANALGQSSGLAGPTHHPRTLRLLQSITERHFSIWWELFRWVSRAAIWASYDSIRFRSEVMLNWALGCSNRSAISAERLPL